MVPLILRLISHKVFPNQLKFLSNLTFSQMILVVWFVFKREKASARASSDRFLPMIKPNIQNNAINCTNLGKQ